MISAVESSAAIIMSFIYESNMDTTNLPVVPTKDDLDGYLLQVYGIKLTSILVELKNLFDLDHSRYLNIRQNSKDIVQSYTSLVTDVWHTEVLVDRLNLSAIKPKDIVTEIRETINKLIDNCVILA